MGRNIEEFVSSHFEEAIRRHEIQAFYQPVIRTSSGKLCSFEALARWIDPEIGMIYPDEFIPVLEKEKNIYRLDEAILTQVCERIRSTVTRGETPIPVSVNLSRLDFTLCDIFTSADQIVSDFQIPHDFIYFEITESVMAEQKELLKGIVDKFRSAGYQIWMDDFGSAYSSLNALKEFSFDELKLDMCFVRPFTLRSKRIATSVVEMAKSIEIHTLVEGVEDEEQFRYFRNIGCEKVQGYYFGKPMPYEDSLANILKQGISIEEPQDRQYYETIGTIDYLSAVPFMTREERDALVSARQLNSIPLALAEFAEDSFSVLFYNSAFEETAGDTGLVSIVFTQDMLCRPQPYSRLSDKMINLMDSVRNGGDGRMLFTYNEDYYEVQVRCMAKTKGRYCVLIRITDLSKEMQSENTSQLDEFVRRVYALFERITLVNIKEDIIRPLYIATRKDLVSGRRGIRKLLEEYAGKYIYPDDRESYISLFDPKTVAEHFADTSTSSISQVFRTSVRHGQYAWKEYTLLKLDDDNYFMLIRNVHDSIAGYMQKTSDAPDANEICSPAHLWENLVKSDLLRIFWKDTDRRFLGASKAFLDYYGFDSLDDIIGKNDEDLGWHIHPDRYRDDEYQVIHEGVTTHNIPGLCTSGGESKEILASKTPMYDDNGKIKGLIGYFIDRELLTANDKRGKETLRRDMLTGLLNFRGLSEEIVRYRDEYYLRNADFVRIHIEINDFNTINEQYGFDLGDKILTVFGKLLEKEYGRTCAVARYMGHRFIMLCKVKDRSDAFAVRDRIKEIGKTIREVGGTPVTLYLSIGFALFSEYGDLEEQAKHCELRLHADYDDNISAESRIAHASELFHLFDDLPLSYSVYRVTRAEHSGRIDAVIFYVNKKYAEYGGKTADEVIGHSVRELYPSIEEDWFDKVSRAAFDGEPVDGDFMYAVGGKRFKFTARQILYPGYCAVTYLEIPE
ncbi:MAG: EAL domain-containing protein [Eubacterium sp.]|nr:EAL domain-containing protein [Eubacterium sp.]